MLRNNPTVCIYSTVFGSYDLWKKQPSQTIDCDFWMYTDRVEESSGVGDVSYTPRIVEPRFPDNPRMSAKYWKLHPEDVLDRNGKPYDITIYIDGSAKIKSRYFAQYIIDRLGAYPLLVFKHPIRSCIYEEAEVCKGMEKYVHQDVLGQVEMYKKENYPANNGLWACGLLLRRNTPAVRKLNKLWFAENQKYTYQDQLSFPYVLWRTGTPIATLWDDQYDNPYIDFKNPHRSEK